MNRSEFIDALRAQTGALPEAERARLEDYYNELIDDSVEDGIPEEEAVAALGDPAELVRALLPHSGARTFSEGDQCLDALREIHIRALDADITVVHAPLDNGAAVQFRVSDPECFQWLLRNDTLEISENRTVRRGLRREKQRSVHVILADVVPERLSIETRGGDMDLSGITLSALVTLSSGGGDMQLEDCACEGSFALNSRSGDISLTGCRADGDVRISTISGDVELREVSAEGELRAESVSGDVNLRGGNAARVGAQAVSGDVEIQRLRAGDAVVHTVSGDSRADEIEVEDMLACDASSGDIDIVRCAFRKLQLTAASGDITVRLLNLPGGMKLNADTRCGTIRLPRRWTPPAGEGEKARVDARTVSGDIEMSILD